MDLSSLNATGLKKLIKLVESRDGIRAKLVTIEKAIGHALLGSPKAEPKPTTRKKRRTRKTKAVKKVAPAAVKEMATSVKAIKPTRKKATGKKKS